MESGAGKLSAASVPHCSDGMTYFTTVVDVPGYPPSLKNIAGIRAINGLPRERDKRFGIVSYLLSASPFDTARYKSKLYRKRWRKNHH